MRPILCCLGFSLFAGPLAAADWPQWRGSGGLGISTETGLPTEWSSTKNVRWKVDLPGRGLSAPVIAQGRVYVTACTGPNQQRLHVLCFDEATGKKRWQRQFWATGSTQCNPKTCMAAPTPATDGKRVYALFATCDLACLDRDGDLVWYRSLVGDYPTVGNNVGMAASPALAKKALIVSMENAGESFSLAVDKRTGKNLWKVERPSGINWVTPLVIHNNGREEAIFQSDIAIWAQDVETGKKRWNYKGSGLNTIPSPVFGDGMLFTSGGKFLALRPGGDKVSPHAVWQKPKLQMYYASPLYYQGRLYTLNSVSVLTCTEAATGQTVWQQRLKGPFAGSPTAADGKIYCVNENGLTTVVQLGKTPKILASNELSETILAGPVIANGAVYLRSDKRLYCIGKKK
jgi:outer membrane protein assembly factor BamB